LRLINEIFQAEDSLWRGIGIIPESGLAIKEEFRDFDAEKKIPVQVEKSREPKGCLCGLVIQGKKSPVDCPYFAKQCTPRSPIGPCMVSSEGSCQAFFKYGQVNARDQGTGSRVQGSRKIETDNIRIIGFYYFHLGTEEMIEQSRWERTYFREKN
jgi:hypothetical protein